LLYNLMKEFGFVGHYKEYWHFWLWDPLSEYIRAKRQNKSPQIWYWIINIK
jgi:D-alanyl-D-alanine dipeptidase